MGGAGPTPFLSAEAEAAVATGRFRTRSGIGGWIRERYGASYTSGRRLQPAEAAALHAKADPERQDAGKRAGSSERPRRPA
jgi:hypothetical protein